MNGNTTYQQESGAVAFGGLTDTIARHAPAIVLAYLVVQCVSRIIAPGGLSWDEAEQVVLAQSLELGYGVQPPLYNWLQWGVFQITGIGKAGLALMKFATLAAVYLGLWTLARQLGGDRRVAAVAMFAGLLMPTLVWAAQRDLTHLVLATGLAIWTVIALIAAIRAPGPGRFALLGLLMGLGVIAKWNYPLLFGGFLVAVIFEPRARSPYWAVAILVALATIALPASWVLRDPSLTLSGLGVLEGQETSFLADRLALLRSFSLATLTDTAILLIAMTAIFGLSLWRAGAQDADHRIIALVLAGAVLVFFAIAFVAGFENIRERWMLPLVILLPVVAALRVAGRMTAARLGLFLGLVGLTMATALVMYPRNIRLGGENPASQAIPVEAAARAIGLTDQTVLIPGSFLAGNMLLVRPDLTLAHHSEATPTVAIWWQRSRDAAAEAPGAFNLDIPGAGAVQSASFAYPAPHDDVFAHFYWVEAQP